jgi:hypothetical protein
MAGPCHHASLDSVYLTNIARANWITAFVRDSKSRRLS